MMKSKKGIPVSPGLAIGQAVVIDAADQPVPRRTVPAKLVPKELHRLEKALADSCKDIEVLRDKSAQTLGPELAKIFNFHLGMLRDQHLINQFKQMIDAERTTAAYTVYAVMRRLAHRFEEQEDRYYRERVDDIWDLERRILGHLIGSTRAELSHLAQDSVVIAHDLTPSQTASLDTSKVKALATDAGGQTSHTAILAHAMGIPAIVGLEDITSEVNSGDTVVIDGDRGLVIIDPDAATLLESRESQERMVKQELTLDEIARLPAVSKDGVKITLLANIEFPEEIASALRKGATGVGLYRTEYLFLANEHEPPEEQQYESYLAAVKAVGGRPLTIRTMDLGADKLRPHVADAPPERNPFLGCRSIRLCLQDLPLFKTQLRAILRASAEGPIRVMFPLISSLMELRQAKMVLHDVMVDLESRHLPFDPKIPVGIMVEVPSVALQAVRFSKEVAFFSIGTNDLIQYTVAVDRSNERLANLYSPVNPAVIQLIKEVVRAANRAGIDVSLCGEMAAEPEYTMLLLGLGLKSFSITPPAVPHVKKVIRSVTLDQCRKVARKVASLDSEREIMNYLREELYRVTPEAFDLRVMEV